MVYSETCQKNVFWVTVFFMVFLKTVTSFLFLKTEIRPNIFPFNDTNMLAIIYRFVLAVFQFQKTNFN